MIYSSQAITILISHLQHVLNYMLILSHKTASFTAFRNPMVRQVEPQQHLEMLLGTTHYSLTSSQYQLTHDIEADTL